MAALKFSLKDVTVKRADNLMDQIQEVSKDLLVTPPWPHELALCFMSVSQTECLFQLCDAQDEVNQVISSMAGAGTPLCSRSVCSRCRRQR